MDVLCYCKEIKADIAAGQIGHFRSTRAKFNELVEGYPDFIWVFRTPGGVKGRVQLVARLRWSDAAVMPFVREPGQSYIFCNPKAAGSVRFLGSDSDAAIEATTTWAKRYFPNAMRVHFQGDNGQLALRGEVLNTLSRLANSFESEPFIAEAGA